MTASPSSTSPALDCWYLTGPTASGKTRIGLELARQLDAEIISLDSMSIYRGMNIGTAKPTPDEQAVARHHLLDVVDPNEEYSLAQYVDAAHAAIAEIRSRGREVLFVGGTPLYLKSLLRGIYQGPPPDWEFREQVAEEVRQVGVEALHQRLQQVDPLAAAKLHPRDLRRIIRALEVYKVTGRPISHQQTHFDAGTPAEQCRVFVLEWPRAQLHSRIEQRVQRMFATGLIAEVESLRQQYPAFSRTAAQAVGYCEVLEHLRGERSLPAAVARVMARTRQFARRQETWFRSLCECRPIPLQQEPDAAVLAATLIAQGQAVSR